MKRVRAWKRPASATEFAHCGHNPCRESLPARCVGAGARSDAAACCALGASSSFLCCVSQGLCETHPSSMRRAGSRTSTSPDTVHRRLAAGVSSNSIDWGSCACGQERRPGKTAMPECQKQCNKNTAGRGGARSTQYFACPQSSVSVMVSSKHRSRFATTGCSGSLRQRPAQAIANKIPQCLHVMCSTFQALCGTSTVLSLLEKSARCWY